MSFVQKIRKIGHYLGLTESHEPEDLSGIMTEDGVVEYIIAPAIETLERRLMCGATFYSATKWCLPQDMLPYVAVRREARTSFKTPTTSLVVESNNLASGLRPGDRVKLMYRKERIKRMDYVPPDFDAKQSIESRVEYHFISAHKLEDSR